MVEVKVRPLDNNAPEQQGSYLISLEILWLFESFVPICDCTFLVRVHVALLAIAKLSDLLTRCQEFCHIFVTCHDHASLIDTLWNKHDASYHATS